MGSKLEEITHKLQDIVTQQNTLNLLALTLAKAKKVAERTPTTSGVNKDQVFGRENDKKAILEVLKSKATYELSNVCVMPIWGMGGLGKTTLAQLIYDDDSLKVDAKGWICVSEDFSVLRITKTILYKVAKVASHGAGDLDSLQKELKTALLGKRFLIVLDDIWDVSYNDWNLLLSPLQVGAPGSVIIVTTRFEDISKMTGTVQAHSLGTLNKDDCVSILAQHALGATNFDSHPNLKEIGKQIAHRWKGLPLAARTVGGLLHNNLNLRDWKTVRENRIWDFQEEKNEIPLALRLSYYYLPSHLKRCFAYCAVFPKDYEFNEDELVQLWMAEGFLEGSKAERNMECLCRQYFRDLCSRSFFQKNESLFLMHDFIHDLAQEVARDICYNFEDKVKGELPNAPDKARYFAFACSRYDVSKKFAILSQMNRLRTFLALPKETSRFNYLSGRELRELLPNLRYLRSLSLAGYEIDEIPERIGDLKHMRYLNFSCTEIKCLPETVGNLFNLQTLLLQGCRKLIKLPSSIVNLINLQFLDISGTNDLQEVPLDIGKLKSLKTLQKFTAKDCKGLGIGELSHLQNLSVSGLDNVDVRNASTVKLNAKSDMKELEMIWSNDVNDSGNEGDRYHILDSLKPHTSLQVLKITRYSAARFPYWMGDPSFSNLKEVTLCNCGRTSLPPLGRLPSLTNLHVEGMDGVETVDDDFYGNIDAPFPSLLCLKFFNMPKWKKWSFPSCVKDGSRREFSQLLKLHIRNCPELVGRLPQHLLSLSDLEIDTWSPSLEVGDLPSLQRLDVRECSEAIFKGNMVGLSNLKMLNIKSVSDLTCLNRVLLESLVALETLHVNSCKRLTSIWEDGTDVEKLSCLHSLNIVNCSDLETLVRGEEGLLPRNLKYLYISDCDKLEKLPNGLCSLTSLETLMFLECPKLKSIFQLRVYHVVLKSSDYIIVRL